jgi:uncharacterized membrane protein YidH (DUF202 family)
METIEILAIIALIIIPLIIGLFIGRWMDPEWQCKFRRKQQKKNFVVLNILDGDSKTFKTVVVDATSDVINVDGHIWVVSKGHIYRKDKKEMGTNIKKQMIEWGDQGVPNIYVNKDSLIPISLVSDEMRVKPHELSAALNSYVLNSLEQEMNSKKKQQMIMYVIALIALVTLAFAYLDFQNTNDLLEGGSAIATTAGASGVSEDVGTVKDDKIVIEQTK